MNRSCRGLRIGLGILVAAYAAVNGLLFIPNVTLVRLGVPPLFFPQEPSPFLKVLTEVPWWQFLLWPIAVGLFAWAAHRLLTGRVALKIYSLALAIDLAFLAMLKMAGARSGHSGAIDPDYIVAAVMALVVLAIRAAEHRPKAVGDAAHNPD